MLTLLRLRILLAGVLRLLILLIRRGGNLLRLNGRRVGTPVARTILFILPFLHIAPIIAANGALTHELPAAA